MKVSEHEDKTWLVKSSGRILGPFSLSEVTELLRTRQISVIDEVREPTKLWGFIREHQELQQVVRFLRDQESSGQAVTADLNISQKTITLDVPSKDDLTPAPERQPVVIEAQERTVDSPPPKVSYRMPQPGPWRIKRHNFLLLSIAFVVGVAVMFIFIEPKAPHKDISTDEMIKLARANKRIGSYDKALTYYQKAADMGPLDVNSNFQMATLLLEEGHRTLEARRILEEIFSKVATGDPLRIDIQLAIALSHFKDGNYNKAVEIYQSILFSKPTQLEARLNLALIRIFKSDFSDSLKDFQSLYKQGGQEPLIFLGRAIAVLGLNEGEADQEKLKTSAEDLSRLNNRTPEYRLESLLIQAVLAQKLGRSAEAETIVSQLLDEDPQLTRDHLHNLLVDRQIVTWERLAMYCDFLINKFSDTPISKGLAPFCAFEKNEITMAIKRVEDARNQFSSDPLLTGLQAFFLQQSRRSSEALQLARLAAEKSTLASQVWARVCEEQGNWACASHQWNRVISQRPDRLSALRGLGRVEFVRNKRNLALDYVKRGLLLSENYAPLLELKESLDAH